MLLLLCLIVAFVGRMTDAIEFPPDEQTIIAPAADVWSKFISKHYDRPVFIISVDKADVENIAAKVATISLQATFAVTVEKVNKTVACSGQLDYELLVFKLHKFSCDDPKYQYES